MKYLRKAAILYYSCEVDFFLIENVQKWNNGEYQQLLGAAIVGPELKEVLPLCPEMIAKQDGTKKQDCV